MLVTIQGINLELSIENNGSYYAPQWFLSSDIENANFTALASFNNAKKALIEIGKIILDLSKDCTMPVFFVGSTEKRTRIYAKLLKKHNINFVMEVEPDETKLAIRLI